MNCVGAFGMGPASYWWARLVGSAARSALALQGRDPVWQFLYADDLKWVTSGADAIPDALLCLFVLALLNYPFSWHKCGGGFQTDWIGYWCDYGRFCFGISEARAKWLIDWIDRALAADGVLLRDFAAVLGRLSFAAGPLERVRPSWPSRTHGSRPCRRARSSRRPRRSGSASAGSCSACAAATGSSAASCRQDRRWSSSGPTQRPPRTWSPSGGRAGSQRAMP